MASSLEPPHITQNPCQSTHDEIVRLEPITDSGGGHEGKHILVATARVSVVLVGALVIVVPLGVCFMVEEGTRKVLRNSDGFNVRMFAWSYLTVMYDDVVRLSSLSSPFASMRWRFPEQHSYHQTSGNKLVALTIDDAPGDNPTELGALLDTLKLLKAKATFFCTTNYITKEMLPLMWRIVKEGHEVANHCPEDRIYSNESEQAFQKHLDESSSILEPFFQHQDNRYHEEGYGQKWKWFRPPSGQMSNAMASVLTRRGYSNVLGDCFSNDVFVGGTLKHTTPGPNTVAYHTNYCLQRVKAGSITIFHAPQRIDRLMCHDIVDSFIRAAGDKELSCVSLSELALAVNRNSSTL